MITFLLKKRTLGLNFYLINLAVRFKRNPGLWNEKYIWDYLKPHYLCSYVCTDLRTNE